MSVCVEIVGKGSDLALLHGWGMHGGVWDGVRDVLARRFRLHIVDLPGYGASPAFEPYTLERLAHAVAAALPEKFHVCGWSLGGQVALEMALLFPDQIERLVLTAATPCFTVREGWPCAMPHEVLLEFATALESDYEGTLKRFLALQARGGDEAKSVLKRLRDILFARGHPDVQTLRAGLNILLESDLRNQVATIKAPTLLLHGGRDMLTPVGSAHWLAEQMPGAHLEVLSGAAHAPFLSHPAEFIEIVTGFLGPAND
ncbi:bioH protein [Sulfuricella denitrificans skB26]|uniref:Pimeloyl-[acyl-carrier protein] methyl ester esterase n=1 Tax=Sulfuricella denitrificans (strain DSM 22764 / NBRC 105220 / skB26) TaxID=1163617 RepID=S6ANL2_SULDS|nr:pimeloyl-ACP methyl ester esterase BioH [Sulfuricella denitrificans]BAN36464.1 bioH protein [Sulfuricella denitrificans skB26]